MNKFVSIEKVQNKLSLFFANVLIFSFLFSGNSYSFEVVASDIMYGGALQAAEVDVEFVDKSSSSFQISNNHSTGSGGALYFTNSSVIFNADIVGQYNSAKDYGGVGYFTNSTVTLMDNINLQWNKALTFDGGALYFNNSEAIFSGSFRASYNSAERHGGALGFYMSTGKFNRDVEINNNNTVSYGGGLFTNESTIMMSDGSIETQSNKANYGGGMFFQKTVVDISSGVLFAISNIAVHDGGGVYFFDGSSVNFEDPNLSFFVATENSAGANGGGVMFYKSTGNLIGILEFSRNVATSYGGGLYVNASSVTATDQILINGNKANYGGGAFFLGSVVNLHSVSAENNVANVNGGALYAYTSNVKFSSNNSTFKSNKAVSNGGVVHNYYGALYFPSAIPKQENNTGGMYNNAYTLCYVNNAIRENCYCPVGQKWNGSSCVTCTGGTYWNGSSCVCPAGQNWNGSYCVACPGGTYWNGSSCVCPAGQNWNGSSCVNSCSNGMVWNGSYCACPSGQYLGYDMQYNGWVYVNVYRCWPCKSGLIPYNRVTEPHTRYDEHNGVCVASYIYWDGHCSNNYTEWFFQSAKPYLEEMGVGGCDASN